jgi:hypothetical protein
MALPEILTLSIPVASGFMTWPAQVGVVLGAALAGAGPDTVRPVADLMGANPGLPRPLINPATS